MDPIKHTFIGVIRLPVKASVSIGYLLTSEAAKAR